jgi:hypothetical protein
MSEQPVRPEDLLPAGVDSGVINGTEVRKGSVAAFVANAKRLETVDPAADEYAALVSQLRALKPALQAVGLLDVFAPRSARVAEILADS